MEKKIEIDDKVNAKLGGKLFIPKGKGPFPGVIFFHGSGGIGETHFETAKMLSTNGILGFAFNYRGVGLSDGKFEEQTIADGVIDGNNAVGDFINNQLLDKERLGFVGGSFGGYIAAILAGVKSLNVKSIVLVAPAAYHESKGSEQRDADSDLDKGFEKSNSYKIIRKYEGNLQIQICEFDDVLPKGMAEKYFSEAKIARRKELYVIKGAKHRLSIQPKQKKESQEKIIQWFKETL